MLVQACSAAGAVPGAPTYEVGHWQLTYDFKPSYQELGDLFCFQYTTFDFILDNTDWVVV